MFVYSTDMHAWEAHDPTLTQPIAAPLEQCAELLGVDLATVFQAAAQVEPYVRVDGTKVWSLLQLERQLRPQAYGRVRAATSPVGAPTSGTPEEDSLPWCLGSALCFGKHRRPE